MLLEEAESGVSQHITGLLRTLAMVAARSLLLKQLTGTNLAPLDPLLHSFAVSSNFLSYRIAFQVPQLSPLHQGLSEAPTEHRLARWA